eukprot:Skav204214  [mRNA]  locus=scaffold1606:175478:177352:- [translate_table: standard]
MQTFRSVRECGDADWVRSMLRDVAHGFLPLPNNGVTTTLFHRLSLLGWTINLQGHVVDNFGAFDLFRIDIGALQFRAEQAWLPVVWQQVSTRKFFDGLYRADVDDTRRWLAFLNHKDAAAFRKILNGAHFTADPSAHWNEGADDRCEYCGCSDSRYHRFWECDHFDSCRQGLSEGTRALLPTLPQALTCGGWSLKPCTLTPWRQYLASIPEVAVDDTRGLYLSPGCWCDLFTDGSCFHQADASVRCAGWSIVQAAVGDIEAAHIVGYGPLPGLLQTSFRAELHAAVVALELVAWYKGKLRLWCDNEGVVKGLRRLLSRGRCCRINQSNYDLWRRASEAIVAIGFDNVRVTHVPSHQLTAQDAFEVWLQDHNALADKMAVVANRCRPPWVVRLHRDHLRQTTVVRRLNREIQRTQLLISTVHFQTTQPVVPDVHAPLPVSGGDFTLTMQPVVSAVLSRKYGYSYVSLLYSWLWSVVQLPSFDVESPCWISSYQLYIDFNTSVGHPGPVVCNGDWITEHDARSTLLPGYKFKTLCRWWSHTLNDLLVDLGNRVTRKWTRPQSDVLCLHTGCFWFPWPPERLKFIESWFASRVQGVVTRRGTILDTLQPSGHNVAVPAVDRVHLSLR